jgi:hypothetical protein
MYHNILLVALGLVLIANVIIMARNFLLMRMMTLALHDFIEQQRMQQNLLNDYLTQRDTPIAPD